MARQADRPGAILMAVVTSRARSTLVTDARRDPADGALTPARVLARRVSAATAGAARRVCGPCRCRRSTTGWNLRRRCPPDAIASPVSYTHLRAHETRHDLVCRLLLE